MTVDCPPGGWLILRVLGVMIQGRVALLRHSGSLVSISISIGLGGSGSLQTVPEGREEIGLETPSSIAELWLYRRISEVTAVSGDHDLCRNCGNLSDQTPMVRRRS